MAADPMTTFDQEKFDEIVERVSGGEFTAPILRDLGIPPSTFYHWLKTDPEREAVYQAAKDHGEEILVADTIAIADDGSRDYRMSDDGRVLVDADHIQRSKLRIETRLKVIAKFNPKRWGDKTQTEHSGRVALISHEEWLEKLE